MNHGPGCEIECFCYIPGLDLHKEEGLDPISLKDLEEIKIEAFFKVSTDRTFYLVEEHVQKYLPSSCQAFISTLKSTTSNTIRTTVNSPRCARFNTNKLFQKQEQLRMPRFRPVTYVPSLKNNCVRNTILTTPSLSISLTDSNNNVHSPGSLFPGFFPLPPLLEETIQKRIQFAKEKCQLVPSMPVKSWSEDHLGYLNRIQERDELVQCMMECDFCQVKFKQIDPLIGALACGHIFHGDCIVKWLERSFNCPRCFRALTKSNRKLQVQFR